MLMMTCTLDLYTDYLLSSTGPTTATGLSRLLERTLSHDLTRWLSSAPWGSAEVWRQAKPLIRQAEAQRGGGGRNLPCSSPTIRCWKRPVSVRTN